MENEKIDNNNIIYETSDNRCEKCYRILETKNVELKYEGFNTFRWQKEKLMYCNKCKNYYTTNEKIDDLNKKISGLSN